MVLQTPPVARAWLALLAVSAGTLLLPHSFAELVFGTTLLPGSDADPFTDVFECGGEGDLACLDGGCEEGLEEGPYIAYCTGCGAVGQAPCPRTPL